MRLRSSAIQATGQPITFSFDGQPVQALTGETIAAALFAAGHRTQRQTARNSPRGVFCGMGVCYDCLVQVDGKVSQRACLTEVQAGMAVLSQRDDVDLTNAEALAEPPDAEIPEESCELLIIGAGPAGLAAAVTAAEAGLSVTVLDERPYPGGQFYKPLAPSHAVAPGKSLDAQFSAGRALFEQAHHLSVKLLSKATVWGGMRDESNQLEIGVLHEGHARIFRPQYLIIATGAYERALPLPGWTLPGVMTTGAAQTLARSYRIAPGRKILIAGNGPLNLQVACELIRGGARVLAVVEAAPAPWHRPLTALRAGWHSPQLLAQGLGYLADLRRAGVEVLYQHVITRIEGETKAEQATIARLAADGTLQKGSERSIDVDAVCMGYGFLPSSELARQLGCKSYVSAQGQLAVERSETGRTSIPNIYVVGEAGGIGGAQIALRQGQLAACELLQSLGRQAPLSVTKIQGQLRRQQAFQNALWSLFASPRIGLRLADPETFICRCEEIKLTTLQALIEDGVTHLGTLKRLTRAGMGRCQGRYCATLMAELIRTHSSRAPKIEDYFASQLPLKPIPLTVLAVEKPEWGGHRRRSLSIPEVKACSERKLETDVLIIGAGIAGCCTAYFLTQAGCETLIAERGTANAQASGANAGSLHVQLLSFDFGAKAEAGGGPAAATLPLQKAAVDLWRELEKSLAQDFEIRIKGGLMVAETAQELEFLKAKVALERAHGIDTELIRQTELRELAPAVSERMIGAAYCAAEGKINPLTATFGVLAGALAAGVQIQNHTQVLAIEPERTGYVVKTSQGLIHCRRIVNAAGAWAGQIAAMLGIHLPVHGAPLQMIVTEVTAPLIQQLIAHADRHLTLKQVANGNLIIGGGWTADINPQTGYMRVLRRSLEGNLWIAQRVIPALAQLHILRSWAAMNVNIDGAPVLGEVPGLQGFYNAVTSNGYTLGPMMGRITADLIAKGRTDWDVAPFAITRFG